jgi:hypothetical protein
VARRRGGVRWGRLLPVIVALALFLVLIVVIVATCGDEEGNAGAFQPTEGEEPSGVDDGEAGAADSAEDEEPAEGEEAGAAETEGASDEGEDPGEQTTAIADGQVETVIGEEVNLAGVTVLTAAISQTGRPALPDSTVQGGPPPGPGSGNYYQAFLVIRNASRTPVRVEPSEFTLEADGHTFYIDPARSGPSSRTLLPGASLDVILTFPAPADLQPSLVYRPVWFRGTLTVKGEAEAAVGPEAAVAPPNSAA